ncbi:MAG: hypothetical protein GJ680_17740 [Alteromonadaceae bacterium]|nr:hypothetical protein [Alteromonadaceae bacterium]
MASQPVKVESIAKDIKEYFQGNPHAGDTVEGIASWWITKQSLNNARDLVLEALEMLVQEGELHKRVYGGRVIYVREALH